MFNNIGIVIKKPFATLRQERLAKLENGLNEKSLRFQEMVDKHEINHMCAQAEDSFELSNDQLDQETELCRAYYDKFERQCQELELRKEHPRSQPKKKEKA